MVKFRINIKIIDIAMKEHSFDGTGPINVLKFLIRFVIRARKMENWKADLLCQHLLMEWPSTSSRPRGMIFMAGNHVLVGKNSVLHLTFSDAECNTRRGFCFV